MGVLDWLGRNWQWTVSILLLLTTIAVSSQSYITQIRAGVREALEQLESDSYDARGFMKIILHDFHFLRGKTVVALKFYSWSGQSGVAQYKKPDWLIEDMAANEEDINDALKEIEEVYSVEITDHEILVGYKARSPVDVRRKGEECLRSLHVATHGNVDDY